MRRGELWTGRGPGYGSKPRPVVIVQADHFDTDSVTVCPLTTDVTDAPLIRIPVPSTRKNGLQSESRLMVDRVTTTKRSILREKVGVLEHEHMVALERSLAVFLGLAD